MNELELMEEINKLDSLIKTGEFVSRDLKSEDWSILERWWKWWRWPLMPKSFLPENGTGGIMIEKDHVPICAGFLYLTNSKVVILEWIISNPEYKEDDRKDALKFLITEAEDLSKELDYEYMFSIGRHNTLIDMHKDLGWEVDKRASYEITKKL